MRFFYLGLASVLLLIGCSGSGWETEFKKECLKQIKNELVSPSEMKIIEYESFREPDEYHSCHELEDSLDEYNCRKKIYDAYSNDPESVEIGPNDIRYVAYVDFDAPNRFNVPIRREFMCDLPFDDTNGPPENFFKLEILEFDR